MTNIKQLETSRIDQALANFNNGHNCSQAVACAYADHFGVDEELMFRMSIGFGGGINGLALTCGALNGVVILAGLKSCQRKDLQISPKSITYPLCGKLVNEFLTLQGYTTCTDILENQDTTIVGRKKVCCLNAVRNACLIIEANLLNETK